MSGPTILVAKASSLADWSWCRLVQSLAGDQVLASYRSWKPLMVHLNGCAGCASAAGEYDRLSHELQGFYDVAWTAPPDFVDRVMDSVVGPDMQTTGSRSSKDKAVLIGAAALSGSAVVVAAMARHRRAAA